MKVLLIGLLLVSMLADSRAQQRSTRHVLTRAQIREAELRLSELGYWTGPIDGRLDEGTTSALIAFQKWEGRAITGKLTIDELEAIRNGVPPKEKDVGYPH